jgi:hypothetical protein
VKAELQLLEVKRGSPPRACGKLWRNRAGFVGHTAYTGYNRAGPSLPGVSNLHLSVRIAACAAFALPCLSFAAEPLNIRPGLWDTTQTMTMSGAPLYIEGMNAAARENYAKSWAKDVGKAHTDTDKECITAKEIKDATLFQDQSQKGKQCKQTVSKQTPTAWVASSECKDEKTTNVIQLDYAAPSPDRFTGSMKSTMTTPNGKTVIDMKMSGKWVGASCPDEESDEEPVEEDDSGEEPAE